MLAGFLIAVPMLLTAYAAQTDRLPHKIVLIAVVTVAIAVIMALIRRAWPRILGTPPGWL
jgi:NADH:ubiquinone oxidoreductase subunit 2 (subunit N)